MQRHGHDVTAALALSSEIRRSRVTPVLGAAVPQSPASPQNRERASPPSLPFLCAADVTLPPTPTIAAGTPSNFQFCSNFSGEKMTRRIAELI